MTTNVIEAPAKPAMTTIAPTIASAALPVALTADEMHFSKVWTKIRSDAYFWPKLAIVLAASFLPIYAIGWAATNESFGVTIAIIPDMLAAGALLAGILFGTVFLDDASH